MGCPSRYALMVYVLVGIVWIFWPTLKQRFGRRSAKPSS